MSSSKEEKKIKWVTREESYKQTFTYLTKRMRGEISSFKTPWPKYNMVGIDGWEWGSAIALCARPGVGKTVQADELCRKAYQLNPGVKMRILKFELEMLSQVTAIREFSSILGKSYSYVCSAEEEILVDDFGQAHGKRKLTQEELVKCWEYVQRKNKKKEGTNEMEFPEDLIEVSPSVKEFEEIVHDYMAAYKTVDIVDGKEVITYMNTVVVIDHLRLLMKEEGESEQNMLYNACLTINRLKKQFGYPIIFVALNHLLRDVNSDARTEPGKASNYLRDSDIFGADAIMQNFDIVVVKDRPAARNIKYYGPKNYIIEEDMIVDQFVKVRNGSPIMAFFKGEFAKMQIVEIDPPPTAIQKLSTKN
jgi:Cdc6-like AAA superfamily ATPase